MLAQTINRLKKSISRIDLSFVLASSFLLATFVLPVLMLYFFDAESFDYVWKGRAPYLLFIWLLFLEMFLGWNRLKEKYSLPSAKRTLAAAFCFLIPSFYVLSVFMFGLKQYILSFGIMLGVPSSIYGQWFLEFSWPLSLEIIVFAVSFAALVYMVFGCDGMKNFSIPLFFLGVVGVFYMLDTFYPYGTLTVLQFFVPLPVSAAAYVLNSLGYRTQIFSGYYNDLGLRVIGAGGKEFSATVSWSCAGIHSLFIYSLVILLFLTGTGLVLKRKIGYALVGALGTFFVNILRIVAILMVGLGGGSDAATRFHEFYGEFFFIAWILIYLFLLFFFETSFKAEHKKGAIASSTLMFIFFIIGLVSC